MPFFQHLQAWHEVPLCLCHKILLMNASIYQMKKRLETRQTSVWFKEHFFRTSDQPNFTCYLTSAGLIYLIYVLYLV